MKSPQFPSIIDVVILGTPIAIGAAFILPFVAIDLAKELIRDRLRDRENQ